MVPKVTSAGRSFKGAAQYYLHDKKAQTADRVAFTETVNLPTADPNRAVAHMIDTATHADQLKKAAGLKGGRPLQKPVYTFALTWHPSETPTREQQLQAATEALTALGMADRQAVIVGHKDTDHTHLHVMVNRVCPDTGRAVSNSNDRLKLSRWAEDYERRHGREFCPNRARNNEARRSGEWRKDESLSRPAWIAWKKAQTADLWKKHRAETEGMQPRRKAQHEALERQREERFQLRRLEIKQLFKPIWRDVFKRQRKELADFDAGLHIRIGYALKQSDNRAVGVLKAVTGIGGLRQDFIRDQEIARKDVAIKQGERIRDAGREVNKAWRYDRDALQASHAAEDQARHKATQAETKAVWEQKQPTNEQTTQPEFDQSSDRRRPENRAERDDLETAPQKAKDEARSKRIRERFKQRRKGRGRNRTRNIK